MSPKQKNISIIHHCEENFYNWLKIRLAEQGVSLDDRSNLSDLLQNHEKELATVRQHIKPLQKWNKTKDECYNLSDELNGSAESDELLKLLIEKTAFEGQILWLTLQEN